MSNIYNKSVPIVLGMLLFITVVAIPLIKGSISHKQETSGNQAIRIETPLDVMGNADSELVRLISSDSSNGQATNHKLIVQNGNNVLESYQFSDRDLQDFEEVEVKHFGGRRVLVVKGLDVGAHSSSMRFFMIDNNITKLEPLCAYLDGKDKCVFSSDRMSEPLIEDLNEDAVPEVVELNVGQDGVVVPRAYQFVSKKVIDVNLEGSRYSLSLTDIQNPIYETLKERYSSIK
jgi:hypothetical protein